LYALNLEDGFQIDASVPNAQLDQVYNQTIGGYIDAGTVTFTPNSSASPYGNSSVVKPLEFDRYHGVYSELSSGSSGTLNLTATAWAGYPYARFAASLTPVQGPGATGGSYVIQWFTLSHADYLLVPSAQGIRPVYLSGGRQIELHPSELTDNFIAVISRSFGIEFIAFEKKPTVLSFDASNTELQVDYSTPTNSGNSKLENFPEIYVGFESTAVATPSRSTLAIVRQLAHSALSFPLSMRIFYTVKWGNVDVREEYNFETGTNDWGIIPQAIIPLPYETNSTTPPGFTLDSVWAPISYVPAQQDSYATFSYTFTVPSFELPTVGEQLVNGTTDAQGIYSAIDYVADTQQAYGGWDGFAYHDGRVATHLLLLYPLLDAEYRAKVAQITDRTLTHYYSTGIGYNPTFDAYRFIDQDENKWNSSVDLGALTAWLFYAAALYTRYVNSSFTPTEFPTLQKIERAVEGDVDWSGLSWANPDPDTSGELLIETAMTFLVYYHLARQASNQPEMDRAMYFIALTENFLHRVFEQPHRYWPYPNFVGQFKPGLVEDHVDLPTVQWNWANTIWGMWMPVMANSYSQEYIDGVKQTAALDWQWNDPNGKKFDPEYLDFNMILLYLHDPDSEKNAQLIIGWVQTNSTGEYFHSAMTRAEEAAQIGYTMLPNPSSNAGVGGVVSLVMPLLGPTGLWLASVRLPGVPQGHTRKRHRAVQ